MVAINKIPTQKMSKDPMDETYTLGTVTISKGEFALSERFNQLIDIVNDIEERLYKLENK